MIRRQAGFTLVELMITMVIFMIVIAAMANIFAGVLGQFKQQSKIAETNIEGAVGLELVRFDLEQAGYGLPWTVDLDGTRTGGDDWTQLARYCEAATVAPVPGVSPNPADYNDGATIASSDACDNARFGVRAPRAVVGGNNVGLNGADYLVVKALNLGTSTAISKWTYIRNAGAGNTFQLTWGTTDEDLENGNRVVVIKPSTSSTQRILLTDDSAPPLYYTQFNTNVATFTGFANNDTLVPYAGSYDTFLIYGVDNDTNLRMPFNRADFFLSNANVPSRCATGTGVLAKSIISQGNGVRGSALPLLDCIADMQVTLHLDMDDNGIEGTVANADGSAITSSEGATIATVQATLIDAALLRLRLKQARVFILAHEGQRDPGYTFNNFTGGGTSILVGNTQIGDTSAVTGNFDFVARGITNYLNYRWKVYQLVIAPYNLR